MDIFYCNFVELDKVKECVSAFDNLETVGIISFFMIFFGIILQIIDIIKTYYLTKINRKKWCIKGKCLHPIIAILHAGALFLYFINVYFLGDIGLWNNGTFGVAYWSGIVSVPVYIVLIIIYRYTKSKLIDREMIGSLMTSSDLQELKIK